MATESNNGGDSTDTFRNMLVPAAIGVVGSAVGFVLTKKRDTVRDALPKMREAIPQLPEGGVGEIADDLRSKLDSVVGSGESGGGGERSEDTGAASPQIDSSEFEKRRAERRKRRDQRRRRAKT